MDLAPEGGIALAEPVIYGNLADPGPPPDPESVSELYPLHLHDPPGLPPPVEVVARVEEHEGRGSPPEKTAVLEAGPGYAGSSELPFPVAAERLGPAHPELFGRWDHLLVALYLSSVEAKVGYLLREYSQKVADVNRILHPACPHFPGREPPGAVVPLEGELHGPLVDEAAPGLERIVGGIITCGESPEPGPA